MKVLEGNKLIDVSCSEFNEIVQEYRSVIIDIGTGDGEFVYKSARQNPDILYIGIDPVMDAMIPYSVKASKKASKGGLRNVLFVVARVEELPDELASTAARIVVSLPWGSLRDGIVKGDEAVLKNICRIARNSTTLDILVCYTDLYEEHEIERRNLPGLTYDYLNTIVRQRYETFGIDVVKIALWNNEMLKSLMTRWAKRLAYGKKREIFYLKCRVSKGASV